jgi:hypothetical protein
VRYVPAVALLAAAGIWWSAYPIPDGTVGEAVIVVAALCALAGIVRLLSVWREEWEQRHVAGAPSAMARFGESFRAVPWEAATAVSIVVLEALHHRLPAHSGVLALVLAAYLLVVRQAESTTPGTLLRGHVGTAVAGVALVILVTAVATIPTAGSGALAGWLEMVGALGAVVAVGFVLPRVSERSPDS